jgi:predicted DNA-binding transcriptional regulator YafY
MASAISNLRIKRIFLIHNILRDGLSKSALELSTILESKGLEVNERIVKADIQFLRDLGAPIPPGNKHNNFKYSKPFTILEAIEGIDFDEVDEVLSYFYQIYKRVPKASFLELDKVFLAFQNRTVLLEKDNIDAIQFEEVDYTGKKWLGDLIKYIQEGRTLRFRYKPFTSEEGERIVLPILLKEYNKRWFLIGLEKETRNYQNFALDRISSKPLPATEPLILSETTDIKSLFRNMIGVSAEGVPEKVRACISNPRAQYVLTKPWHSSQKAKEVEEGIEFEWFVVANRELKAKILEHLADIEILEPVSLKAWLKGVLEKSLSRCL